jgi:tetratricopeptide (TPR) repeat protein
MDPDNHERHIEVAKRLTERLLYEWAEREYRQVIAGTEAGDDSGLEARFFLSDLLFDLGNELASAEVQQTAVKAIDSDPKVLQNFGRSPGAERARMHYRFAMHYARIGDREQHRQRLQEANRHDPFDVDVLIAMYKVPDAGPEWRKKTVERLAAVAGRLREVARQYEQIADNPANQRIRLELVKPLASIHNQFAWLVSNTEGDLQEALRSSQRSLELAPETAAYLDTLGRCYYAVGDLENAIRYQTRAVQREPWTQQIHRQLDFFQKALADSKVAAQDKAPES